MQKSHAGICFLTEFQVVTLFILTVLLFLLFFVIRR